MVIASIIDTGMQPGCCPQVRPTTDDRGNGAFAAQPISAGDFICDYEGEILTSAQYFQRYPDGKVSAAFASIIVFSISRCSQSDFVTEVDGEWHIDASDRVAQTSCFSAVHMNHSRQACSFFNAYPCINIKSAAGCGLTFCEPRCPNSREWPFTQRGTLGSMRSSCMTMGKSIGWGERGKRGSKRSSQKCGMACQIFVRFCHGALSLDAIVLFRSALRTPMGPKKKGKGAKSSSKSKIKDQRDARNPVRLFCTSLMRKCESSTLPRWREISALRPSARVSRRSAADGESERGQGRLGGVARNQATGAADPGRQDAQRGG